MKQQEKIQKVLNFIESNLDDPVSIDLLSELASYSTFHFHRIFSSFIGESLYAYRKRLLLERSVKQLLYSQSAIIEIALNAGYDNPSSFNKAFKKQFHVTPSQCRTQKLSLSSHFIKPEIKELEIVKAEIRNLDPIPVISVRKQGSYTDAAQAAWSHLMQFTYSNKLMKPQVESIGICYDDPSVTEPENIRYEACVTNIEVESLAEGVKKEVIEGGMYAVFVHKGSYENLSKTYAAIHHQWFPDSKYQLRNLPPFEKYLNRDPRRTKPENLRTEIYVPITKRRH